MKKIQRALLLVTLLAGLQGSIMRASAQPTVDYSSEGVCVGSPTTFTVDTVITNWRAVAIWNWDFGDGFFDNTMNPSHTYSGTGTYTVVLTVTDTNGAIGSVTHYVDIQPLPVVFFSYNTPNCQLDGVHFTDLSSTLFGYITTWIWNWGDGTPNDTIYFPDDPNLTHVFPTFGTFNVTLTVTNSFDCTNSASIPVTVTPSPIANFYFTGRCDDQVVNFTDASFPNGGGNIEYWFWDFGDPASGIYNFSNLTNPTHIFSVPGTYTVTLVVTNFNNCTDTMTKQVLIYPHPPVDFTYGTACLNELVYFYPDTVITNVNAIGSWTWDFGDGGVSYARNTAHAYVSPGTYTVTLTVTDTSGCENTVSHTIVINPLPVAHFDAGTTNCAGTTVDFTNLSTTYAGYVVRWDWDFGDGSSQTVVHPANPNVSHLYANPGTYNVTLTITASDSCTDTEVQPVVIAPNPVANFDFTDACVGSAVDFTDLTQLNGGGSLVQWAWNFGDPGSGVLNTSTLQSPSHVYSAQGTYTVTLIVTSGNGCSDTTSRVLTVNPQPFVDFTSTNNCQNNDVQFDPDPSMDPATIATWYWQFGDGGTSPSQSPTHNYTTAGTYTVTLTVTDTAGCINSKSKPVTIIPQPVSNFTYEQPACKDAEVQFQSLASAPVGYIVKWVWNFGDGNSQTVLHPGDPNVTHTYTNYGTFNVTLTVTTNDSCFKAFTAPVVVSANPLANFSYETSCAGSPVQFNDLSQSGGGGMADWLWNFGDPGSGVNNTSTLQNPEHTFMNAGTYNVILIVTNNGGCTDSDTIPVTVNPLPVVDFTPVAGCVNDSTQFISSTFVDPNVVATLLWDFGDGMTATNVDDPYHIYTSAGAFNVTLTVTDTAGCVNSKSHVVIVTPGPTALFQTASPFCANNPVFFDDLSTLSSGQFTSWDWDFGDGNDTTIMAPANPDIIHVYASAGTFTVTLTVHSSLGCEAEYSQTITIAASPLAEYTYDNTCQGTATQFSDLSNANGGTNVVSWLWNFGDPASGVNNTSNLQNPTHIYTAAGTFVVLLQVTNAGGCPDTVSKSVVIYPKPAVEYAWANTCLGNVTDFTTNTTVTNVAAVSTFDWDFGDGSPHANQQDVTHQYTVTGNFTVVLTITDTAGCINNVSHVVTITPQPTAVFTASAACESSQTVFTDQSYTANNEYITDWAWDFGDGGTSTNQNPVHTYASTGTYTVTLIVTSETGCQDTTSQAVQVFGRPTANYTYTAEPCNNGAVLFQDSSFAQQATIVSWLWEFEPGQFSTLQNPVYTFYYVDSCYNVSLVATDIRGCADTIVKQVCVPAAYDFTFTSTATCLRDTTFFTPQILAPADDSLVFFTWNFGDPNSGIYNSSTLEFPAHYYSQPGTYTVSLVATDENNCSDTRYATVVVHPLPIPAFTGITGICDSTLHFTQSSQGNGAPITYWIYAYGDGVIDTIVPPDNPNISHKYAVPGLYYVSLTVTNGNGCSETIADSMLVRPCIEAIFENTDTLICQYNILSFADSSFSGLPITEWYWDFGDGNDTTYYSYVNPLTYTYETSGIFTVKMRISTLVDGRTVSDSTTITIEVIATPSPDFTFEKVCHLSPAVFANRTAGNGTVVSGYFWEFNDPQSNTDTSTLKNPAYTYGEPGSYTVQLVSVNTLGCSDTIQKELLVHQLPDANFEFSLSCAGDPTQFTDLSDSIEAPLRDWEWTFRDPDELLGMSTDQNPEFTFGSPGDYTVFMTVADTNGCIDTLTRVITTYDVPTPIFTYTENYYDIQGQLQFENGSFNAVRYFWDFGNGESSYAENPTVFYLNDGSYDISLIAWSDKECTDTLKMTYQFLVKGLYIPTAFSPQNPHEEVRLFKPVGINLQEYKIEVFDRWGNLLWSSDKIDDDGRPLEGWDGKVSGVFLPQGVYTWKASAVFKDGSIWNAENIGNSDKIPKSIYGTVTLID